MKRNHLGEKSLAIGLLVLFLNMTVVPTTGTLPDENEHSMMSKSCFHPIIIQGTIGANNWYISPVTISFELEATFFVKIDQGAWFEYTIPIVIDTDGCHTVWWYYVDPLGTPDPIQNVTFKMDTTPPTITIILHRIGLFKIGVSANAYDNTSGVVLLEFYVDDMLSANITTPPFEFVLGVGYGRHTVKVIVYDAAGLNGSASASTPYDLCHIQHSLLHKQISRVFQKILLLHQMLVEQIRNRGEYQ